MKTLITSLAILISFISFAQTGTIKGVVTDKSTGETLPFVNVYIEAEAKIGTNTNLEGEYCFTTAPGTYTIVFSSIEYGENKVPNVVINEGDTTVLNKELDMKSQQLNTITVQADKFSRPMMEIANSLIITTNGVSNYNSGKIRGKRNNKAESFFYNGWADFNTEEYAYNAENEFIHVGDEPLSTFSIDVDRASYSNVRRFLNDGTLPPVDAVRSEEMINYFTYNYPKPQGEHPFSVSTELASCPWNSNNKLLHVGLRAKSVEIDETVNSNLVFLLDVSGSMSSADKLPLVKKSIGLLVDNLKDEDRIAIVVYAGAAGLVLPSTKSKNRDKILGALDKLQAGGSTAGGAGIKLAYKTAVANLISNGNNRVILATDGDFNIGQSSEGELVRMIEKERERGVFLTVLGFGTGNYKDSRMESLADKGNGNYAYIDNIMEAKKVLINEMGGTLYTIAKDVKFQLEFNPTKVVSYRLIGYENRLLENQDFNDDTKDAGEMGMGHTVTALYEIVPAGSGTTQPNVDPLKYQNTTVNDDAIANEMITIKLRYKKPKEKQSILFSKVVMDESEKSEEASNNFRWSAAVAQFGMLLRESKFTGTTTYTNTIALAKSAKGIDDNGYRAEFIRMVEMAELLSKKEGRNRDKAER